MGQGATGARRSGSARFLAFCGEPAPLRQWLSSLVPDPDSPERLDRILDCAGLVVYASPETPFATLGANRGVLLGDLSERPGRQGAAALPLLAEAVHAAIRRDPWCQAPPSGGYAAFLCARDLVTVLRGPSGSITILHCRTEGVDAFFSHAELGRQLNPGHRPIPSGAGGPLMIRSLGPGTSRRISTAHGLVGKETSNSASQI